MTLWVHINDQGICWIRRGNREQGWAVQLWNAGIRMLITWGQGSYMQVSNMEMVGKGCSWRSLGFFLKQMSCSNLFKPSPARPWKRVLLRTTRAEFGYDLELGCHFMTATMITWIRNFCVGRSNHDSNHFELRACVILDLGYLACTARRGDYEKEKVVVSQGTLPGIL